MSQTILMNLILIQDCLKRMAWWKEEFKHKVETEEGIWMWISRNKCCQVIVGTSTCRCTRIILTRNLS